MEPRGESCRQPDIADRTRVEHVGATPALLSRQRRVDSVGQHAGRSAARGFQYESHSTVAQHFDGAVNQRSLLRSCAEGHVAATLVDGFLSFSQP